MSAAENNLFNRLTGTRRLDTIEKRNPAEPAVLSHAQQQLWLMDQFNPGSREYLVPETVELTGELNVPALRDAFTKLVQRHEILRTRFRANNEGTPLCVIDEQPSFPFDVEDVSGLASADERQQAADKLLFDLVSAEYSLAEGPLLRVLVIKMSETKHLLGFVMHHVIFDGWSFTIMQRELPLLYEASIENKESELEPLDIQYSDFGAWQRQYSQEGKLDRQIDYWRRQLDGLHPMELPTDKQRPAVRSGNGSALYVRFEDEISEKILALAQQHQSTPFMVYMALYQLLLSKYTRQEDIAVGTPVSGRSRTETEPLIGYFVNTIVIRSDLSDDPSFVEYLERVKDVVLDSISNQDVPFARLVEELSPERDLSRTPLYQCLFGYHGDSDGGWKFPGLIAKTLEVRLDSSKCDLNLTISDIEGERRIRVEYSTDLFHDDTAQRIANHYFQLLSSVLDNPEAPLSQLDMISPVEREQILVEWNNTAMEPSSTTIVDLVRANAESMPDTIALVSSHGEMTYRELNEQANRWANYLVNQGVSRETPVGICLDRGIEAITALLGIVKAGGTYVPLDPNFPAERVSYIANDTQLSLIITQDSLLEAGVDGCRLLRVEETRSEVDALPAVEPETRPSPEDLAYIMYTSGSTGKPKGTMIEHRSILRLVHDQQKLPLTSEDVFMQLAPLAFDASTFEIWAPLAAGARIAIADQDTVNPKDIEETVKRFKVSVIWATIALFREIVDTAPNTFAAVRQVLTGGDVVSAAYVDRIRKAIPGLTVTHAYGPTECTTFTTCVDVTDEHIAAGKLPIGSPISGTEVYVVDKCNALLPVGIPGELLIGGPALSRGYLNQPDLTAEKFVPHPFSADPNALVYRSGDLVRWRSDGTLEFLSRIDGQVKIRGFRIEPGEIEAELLAHSNVEAAIVIVDGEEENKRLVAYIVPREGDVDVASVRMHLELELPNYMIPSVFVPLAELPKTQNGKVDRKALPSPEQGRGGSSSEYVMPQSYAEKAIAEVWSDLLKIERIGIHDNFFELGGHSILATKLINELEAMTGIRLSMKDVFRNPTVIGLKEQLLDQAA